MTRSKPIATPAPFFAFRTPLLPFDELVRLSDGLAAPAADPAALAAAVDADRALVRARLRALVSRPEIREALFVASTTLVESLPGWLERPDSEGGQKVERTLVRYVARMAGRATPFGLFAGCSVGLLGATTRLELEARDHYRRHTRLDGDYLAALTEALGRDPAVRQGLRYRPSSSLYRVAGSLRYAQVRLEGKIRTYHLVAVEPTPYLEATLARAAGGARAEELATALIDAEITPADADAYLAELIDGQVLVSELEPPVTGPEPIHVLIDQLGAVAETVTVAAVLDDARAAMEALDASALGAPLARYRAIAARLAELPATADLARLFQVDLVKPAAHATLGPGPVAEILRALTRLASCAAPRRDDPLAAFRDAFSQRYEEREVPLAEALDADAGIGFDRPPAADADGAPLLSTLEFGALEEERSAPAGPRHDHLLARLGAALLARDREIRLDERDWKALERKDPPPLPASVAVLVTVTGPGPEPASAGDFNVWLQGVSGPSGANLLGRFCHGDPELLDHVRAHLRDEEAQRPDAIFAEIVHLPEGRIGNVLLRPLLRDRELAVLGRSGAPRDRQLSVADLLVSVRGGRVVLRSASLGREVLPRLTTAHNFASPRNLATYRFLCALAHQGVATPGWSWGALEAAPFLPRVREGRVVLALARWRLAGAEIEALTTGATATARFRAAQELRRRRDLPRWVAVADGDNLLPIDLDSSLAVDTFVQLVKDRTSVALTELFEPERLAAHGPEGRFVHEIVLPLLVPPRREVPRAQPAPRSTLARRFAPGSEWLYAKLYTGAATADRVLRAVVASWVTRARAEGALDGWFFMRYADPEPHLRVRLHGEPARLRGEVLAALQAAADPALSSGLLWRIQLDTYEREIERYGGDAGIGLAERIFAADSDAALAIVETLDGDAGADARWRLALRGMDRLLADLGLDLDARRAVVTRLRDDFGKEHRVDATVERRLGEKFRAERRALETLLAAPDDEGGPLEPGFVALARRSAALGPVAAALGAAPLTRPVAALASSFLHMHANRMLRSPSRAQELVLYDFLGRLYEGRAARMR